MGAVREQFDGVRVPMSHKQQEALCSEYMESVHVIYPTPADNITLVPSTRSLLTEAERARWISQRLAAMSDTPNSPQQTMQNLLITLTEGACTDGDSLGPADNVVEAERKAIWKQQMRMNAASAEPPGYLSACRYLGLNCTKSKGSPFSCDTYHR